MGYGGLGTLDPEENIDPRPKQEKSHEQKKLEGTEGTLTPYLQKLGKMLSPWKNNKRNDESENN